MQIAELPDAPQIDALRPMLLDKRKHPPFDSPDWAFEVKYDGWRMLAQFGDGAPTLRTRQGLDASKWFPEVCQALTAYGKSRTVVDVKCASWTTWAGGL